MDVEDCHWHLQNLLEFIYSVPVSVCVSSILGLSIIKDQIDENKSVLHLLILKC